MYMYIYKIRSESNKTKNSELECGSMSINSLCDAYANVKTKKKDSKEILCGI